MVRAKFKVDSVEPTTDAQYTIKLSAVISGSEENDSFFKYTPAGTIVLQVVSKETAGCFMPGTAVYVDFTFAGE